MTNSFFDLATKSDGAPSRGQRVLAIALTVLAGVLLCGAVLFSFVGTVFIGILMANAASTTTTGAALGTLHAFAPLLILAAAIGGGWATFNSGRYQLGLWLLGLPQLLIIVGLMSFLRS